jgi:Uma2 family endonuclease
MAARLRTHATYADLVRVPEHLVAEIIEGELFTSPRPSGPHTAFSSALGADIGPPYHRGRGGPGDWWILDQPELHLHNDVLVPDLAGWRRERMPELPHNQVFAIPPDWVCEVLSPSTARLDRKKKMPIYAREAVEHLWLVEPLHKTVEIYRLIAEQWVNVANYAGNDKFRAEPFELVEIDLPSIWGVTPDEEY